MRFFGTKSDKHYIFVKVFFANPFLNLTTLMEVFTELWLHIKKITAGILV